MTKGYAYEYFSVIRIFKQFKIKIKFATGYACSMNVQANMCDRLIKRDASRNPDTFNVKCVTVSQLK